MNLDGRVAVVTGGGNGIGREHCIQLAAQGARVVVLDRGVQLDGLDAGNDPATAVAEEICAKGGKATPYRVDVTNAEDIQSAIDDTIDRWGQIDILVNNAGVLRDRSFAKLNMDDLRLVMEVHFFGTVNCIRSVWPLMRERKYGRIVVTTSSSGLYGNFGQSAYGAAKLAVIGLMNTLGLEGEKYGIHINAVAPSAVTRMNEELEPEDSIARTHLRPDQISPAVLFLSSEQAPNRTIIGAGAGTFTAIRICESLGKHIADTEISPDDIAAQWSDICDFAGAQTPRSAADQTRHLMKLAGRTY